MQFQRPITPALTIADQPTEADLEALKAGGYTAVVNLRQDGEPEQPLGVEAEGEKARALGLEYQHYAVGGAPLSDPGVAGVCDLVDRHAEAGGKVLLHCRKGGRAAALALIQQARAQGWPAGEAVERGRAMGLEVEGGLRAMVEQYLKAGPAGA